MLNIPTLSSKVVTLGLMGFVSYQRLGFLLILVIVQLIPSQNEPAAVPRFDEPPLLPEPPAPDDTWASVHLCLTSAALGAAAGRARLLHHGGSDLGKTGRAGGNSCLWCLNFHHLST